MSGPSGGGRVYGQHGSRHNPRGSDPSACDQFRNVLTPGTAWDSFTTYSAGDIVDDAGGIYKYQAAKPNQGIEPGVTTGWQQFWNEYASIFQNGGNASGPSDNPVPLRYRISVGPPNYYDDSGDLVVTQHMVEIQGDVEGPATGDTVFTVLPEYLMDYDVPYHTHDSLGGYIPCRLLVSGEFIWNTP